MLPIIPRRAGPPLAGADSGGCCGRRIGLLGGTFDPPHNGHLAVAELALRAAPLDEVIFIPAGQPRLKPESPSATPEQRLAMVRRAIAGRPGFSAWDGECFRAGPTYTVDTLEQLAAERGGGAELHFIMGGDVLANFGRWRAPERVLQLCRLLVIPRPGNGPGGGEPDAAAGLPDCFRRRFPEAAGRVQFLPAAELQISATELRERAAAGQPLQPLLPPAVEEYIIQQGLYRLAGR